MAEFHVVIYAEGLPRPVVVPFSCTSETLIDRLTDLLAVGLDATRADIWDGSRRIMRIDGGAIAALSRGGQAGGPSTRAARA